MRRRLALVAAGIILPALVTYVSPWTSGDRDKNRSIGVQPAIVPTLEATSSTPSATLSPNLKGTTTPNPNRHATYRFENPSLSRNAMVVAFARTSEDERGVRGSSEVFVRNRRLHRSSRISISTDGRRANGSSSGPAVSADGKRVAFISVASNLVEDDTNGTADVFVRDLVRHTTVRVSVASNGRQGNAESGLPSQAPFADDRYPRPLLVRGAPSISADGRSIAFESRASNLVPNDGNGAVDVFLHDLENGETEIISAGSDGAIGNASSFTPSLSADGRLVAFESAATNLTHDVRPAGTVSGVFVRDVGRGTTSLASIGSDGVWLSGRNRSPAISGNGRYVGFVSIRSYEPAFEPDEGDRGLRRDLVRRVTESVVHVTDGADRLALSDDGAVVASVYIMWGDGGHFCHIEPVLAKHVIHSICGESWITLSPDGRYVGFNADNDALLARQWDEDFTGAMIFDRFTGVYTHAEEI